MAKRGRPPYPDVLTPREWEVHALLREGLSNEAIAQRLGISLAGAKYHVSEILSKLGVASREEAAAWTREQRLWWQAGLAPLAALWRRASASWLSLGAIGVVVIALGAGLGLLIWGLLRTDGDGGPNVPEGLGYATFAPGETITADGPGIFFVDIDTGAAEGWYAPGGGPFEFSVSDFSGDGRRLLYTCREQTEEGTFPCDGAAEPGLWWLLDADTGEREGLPAGTQYLSISPDGKVLVGQRQGRFVLSRVEDTGDEIGLELESVELTLARGGGVWSPDSTSVVLSTPDGAIHLVDASTGDVRELVASLGGSARWSPDGSKIVIARNPDPSPDKDPTPEGTPGLLVFDRDGALLWERALVAGNPRWSPDGERLAVQADPPRPVTPEFARDFALDVFDSETGEPLFRLDGAIACQGEYWTADSEKLFVSTYDGMGPYVADTTTMTLRNVGTGMVPSPFEANAAFTFDGQDIGTVDLTTGGSADLVSTTVTPSWFSDHEPLFAGERIVFVAPHGGHGGCSVGAAPEDPPDLAFQLPPFDD